jgi:hypothetical protein
MIDIVKLDYIFFFLKENKTLFGHNRMARKEPKYSGQNLGEIHGMR